VDGRVTLDVAARDLGIRITPPRPEIDTLAGYVQEQIGRQVNPGDTVDVPGFRLSALEIRDGRIRRLRGEPVQREEEGQPEEAGP
jgi:CBS domain containing-hemolysin-like protein